MKHLIYTTIACLLTSMVGTASPTSTTPCAALAVRLTTPQVSNNQLYAVAFCNQGNEVASNSSIDIELGQQLGIAHATASLEARAGNVYRFHIGDVAPGACGSLFFELSNNSTAAKPCIRIYALHGNNCAGSNGLYGEVSHGNVSMGGDDDGNGGCTGNGGGNTINGHSAHQVLSLAGDVTGFVDPIFEDHVFLDVVPTWDSLLHIIGQLSNYDANDPSNNQVSTDLGTVNYDRLPRYAVDKECATDVIQDQRSSQVISVQRTGDRPATWQWTGQPLQQQSTLLIEGKTYRQLRLTLIDASGRQVAVVTGTSNQLSVDRYRTNLNSGIYYYLLEGDQEKIGTGLFAVQ